MTSQPLARRHPLHPGRHLAPYLGRIAHAEAQMSPKLDPGLDETKAVSMLISEWRRLGTQTDG